MLFFIYIEGEKGGSSVALVAPLARRQAPVPNPGSELITEAPATPLAPNLPRKKGIIPFKKRVKINMNEESMDKRESFITMDRFAITKVEEKKSIFHGWASPIHSEQDAFDLIEKAKKQYPDAKHHVYAWILGGNVLRNKYSDDGEPGGTAGMPVFDVLRKNNVEDAIIIVTRYFGGTLLGSGGLVRAYTSTAVKALEESRPVWMKRCLLFDLRTTYADLEKIKRMLNDPAFTIEVNEYGDVVKAVVTCLENKRDALFRSVADCSNGRASLDFIGSSYRKSEFMLLP